MSIAKKVTLVVSLMTGLLVVAIGYAGLQQIEQEALAQAQAQARLLGRVVKLSAESALQSLGHLSALETLVSRSREVSIAFFGRDGRQVAPPPAEETPVVNYRVIRVMERNTPEEDQSGSAYAYRLPLLHRERVVGALELSFDLQRAHSTPWLRTGALVALGALLIFALLVGLFSRRSIARPIDQLMDGMDHVIKGDLTATLPIDRNDEIGRLAYRFNEMTAQLRDAQGVIRRSAEAKLHLEQRLRQSEKLATIGQLSAEIAHEVGTPLNVIGGRARVLARKAEQPAEVTKNSRIIADQAERITKIIERMLDLSRARTPERREIDLDRILEDALSFLEYQIERSAVRVERRSASPLPRLLGDADGLQQVFINLIHNAIQAMPSGGTLSLSSQAEVRRKEGLDLVPPQRFAMVSISDTGSGIAEEHQDKIFEPFYSTKRRGEGTGLGLTVAHGIVKEHDGWIEVANVVPHGSTFRVYLPAEEDPASEDEEASMT